LANYLAFHSIGEALRVYLQSTYPQELDDQYKCTFEVLSSGELSDYKDPTSTTVALTLYLYRVTINETLRNRYQPARQPSGEDPALPVDLHWLLSVWSTSSAAEHSVFAWAMSQLEQQPLLDSTMLPPEAGWKEGDTVQLLPEELPLDEVMRVWESLEPSYRLSASYVTRTVRLDRHYAAPPPVIAIRSEAGGSAVTSEEL